MKNVKGKVLIGIAVIVVALIAVVSSFTFLRKDVVTNDVTNNAELLELKAGSYDLTANQIIVASSKLLGMPYGWDIKGTKVSIYSNTITPSNLTPINTLRNTGVDCSGLVYYTLTSLNCATSGFDEQNPVPYNTYHWYNHFLTGKSKTLQIKVGNGSYKNINVLKKGETITSTRRYYQDSNGKSLPAGSIIVSQNENDMKHDHAWIYLGDLGTSNANDVIEYLVGLGVSRTDLTRKLANGHPVVEALGGKCTHWRIESAGSVGVRINNIDPNANTNDSGKTIGKIYAFQVANNVEIKGEYNLSIQKVDSEGHALGGSNITVKDANGKAVEMKTVNGKTGYMTTKNSVEITQSSVRTNDVFIIEESSAPNGYVKFPKKIKLDVSKKLDSKNNKYVINTIKVYTSAENNKWDEQARSNVANEKYKYFNGQLAVDWNQSSGQISVQIKNSSFDLALKNTITKVTSSDGETKEVTSANGFNVSRDFSESGYTETVNDAGNIGIDTSELISGDSTNATYWMNKTPVEVSVGDIVEYSIKVFNEGKTDAMAAQIQDYIPTGLRVTGVKYSHNGGEASELEQQNTIVSGYRYDEQNGVLYIGLHSLSDLIPAFDADNNTLSYDEFIVTCEVLPNATGVLTNVAEITSYKTSAGEKAQDIDSTGDNWLNPNDGEHNVNTDKSTDNWKNYSNDKQNYLDAKWHPEFVAQDTDSKGDDDDFDKLIVKGKYNLTIKKVVNDAGTDDIDFEIQRTNKITNKGVEDFGTVETVDATIGYSEELGNKDNGTIKYVIKEVANNQYIQLPNQLEIELNVENGKINKYTLKCGSNVYGGMKYTEHTYKFSNKGVMLAVKVTVDYNTSNVNIEIENKLNESSIYGLRFQKVSSGDGKALQGVTFTGTKRIDLEPEADIGLDPTNENGYTNVLTNEIKLDNVDKSDIYKISELSLGTNTGFTKLEKEITVQVNKYTDENEKFAVKNYSIKCDGNSIEINNNTTTNSFYVKQDGVDYEIVATLENVDGVSVLTLKIPNAPDNPVPLQIRKVDKASGEQLTGAEIEVVKNSTNEKLITQATPEGTIYYTDYLEVTATNVSYKITENNAPDGYDNIFAGKYIKVDVTLNSGVPTAAVATAYNADNSVNDELTQEVTASIVSGKVDVEIKNPETLKVVDLALKKVIVEINGKDVSTSAGFDSIYDRVTEGDDKVRIDSKPLQQGKDDAKYFLNKTPVLVTKGNTVKYQIRIYNEGSEIDTAASKIKDYLPSGLELKNVYYRSETTPLVKDTDYSISGNTLIINALDNHFIEKYDAVNDRLTCDYVTVECIVKDTANGIQTNVAEISEYKTKKEDGTIETVDSDRDSEPANWRNPVDGRYTNNDTVNRDNQKWIDYAGKASNVIDEGAYKNYVGQQDDDDFEKLLVGEIDLVLKKVITNIGETSVNDLEADYQRFQDGKININTALMNENENVTTAEYYMNKTPIKVNVNDKVTYQIRIYNEGSINAAASEIKDYIPKGLTLESVSYNGNTLTSGYSVNAENVLTISAMKGNFIEKYDGVEPKYDYVTVVCKVNGQVRGLLTNVAEISEYETFLGTTNVDRDSQTTDNGEWKPLGNADKNTLDGKSGVAWARYYDISSVGNFTDYPLQQDDDDFEKILVTNTYSVKLRKVSNNTGDGLDGVKFKFNNSPDGEEYVTDENGYINIGTYELNVNAGSIGELDAFYINEVETKEGYAKLGIQRNRYVPEDVSSDFWVYARKMVQNDGSIKLNDVYINFMSPRPDVESWSIGSIYDTSTVYTRDVDGNIVPVTLKKSEDASGNVNIEITLGNNIKDSEYFAQIKKVDENGNDINGTTFQVTITADTVNLTQTCTTIDGFAKLTPAKISQRSVDKKDTYVIEEIQTPTSNYYKLDEPIELIVTKALTKDGYKVSSMKLVAGDKESSEGTSVTLEGVKLENNKGTVTVTAKLEGNKITITVPNNKKKFDLSLRKFIVKVQDENIDRWNAELPIDASKLISGEATTAIYNNAKDPVGVHVNDTVRYGIRVYNEGEIGGYAEYVIDDVPEGLEMIPAGDGDDETSILNQIYGWKMYKLVGNEAVDTSEGMITYKGKTYVVTDDPSEAEIIGTDHLAKANGTAWSINDENEDDDVANQNYMYAFNPETMSEPDSKEVQVEFKVKESNQPGNIIENKAQIYEHADNDGNKTVTDRDSTPGVWEETPRDDDQDIERIYIIREKEYDLALRKFITKVNDKEIKVSREPKADCSKLLEGGHDVDYKHSKEPVLVNPEDVVEYTLRIYNEGKDDAYANVIIDDVPEGTQMIAPKYDESGKPLNLNAEYGWKMFRLINDEEKTAIEAGETIGSLFTLEDKVYIYTENAEEATLIKTDYLSFEKGVKNLLKAFNPANKGMTPDNYRDIKVQYLVLDSDDVSEDRILINYAQIGEMSDDSGNSVTDIDSTPGKWEDPPRDDDQDIEKIIITKEVKEFDLSLRKFITKVNDKELAESREPQVDCSKLASGETTTATYTHPKEESPVLVNPKDIVEYTIRVYNEGEMDGYANLVMDDIPEGVQMIVPDYTPDGAANNINAEYKWVMYRKVADGEDVNGKETITYDDKTYVVVDDPAEAEVIVTDYLSIDNGKNENLLKAFNPEVGKMTEENYRDIKVQFVVKDLVDKKKEAGKLIINHAQITDDCDNNGKSVIDRDSTPNLWEETPRNDDQDYDVLKVGYFDLALYKWVSTAIVTVDGKTTEYASNHTQMDKSKMVNVSIPKNKLKDTTVKFSYQVKVENEGTIPGYAKEIKDHIPAGLKFVSEDNTKFGWVEQEDGTITTDYLKDTLLNPGDTAEVTVVLTWVNDSNNLGEKVNYAEISKDNNEFDWPDIDSSTNNFKEIPKEDDEDGDVVLLQVRTGIQNAIYVVIGLVAMSIIAGGVIGIRKFVINE